MTNDDRLDETHDPALRSWVASANDPQTDFPIQNLPFGVFRRRDRDERWRGGVAIGNRIVDLHAMAASVAMEGDAAAALDRARAETLNELMALGARPLKALRLALSRLLREGSRHAADAARWLLAQDDAEYRVPARIGDYTDFYASVHHATNVGRQFRPDQPLLPNYKWVPIGYHGRASSIAVSGQRFHRPRGQIRPQGSERPFVSASRRLDYELEVGVWIGAGNACGEPIAIADAERHVFGLCLLNDWSARDVQGWEYQPLGPFLSKSFATTISPWIVTLDALAPYRGEWRRDADDPQPLPYLDDPGNRRHGAIDLQLEAWIETAAMRRSGAAPVRLSRANFGDAYWNVAQMVAHHTIGGCNLQPGDLFGSGTQSGPNDDEGGSLLELSQGGKHPLALSGGETRSFLEDGDTVILRGWCHRPGFARVGFGECRGTVLPAR
ncbi:MAG: fumarylacetoacetase [Burkholderiaceae bacterium]|nr:fumarylacetoacetase [Burkholderiaceae bacterium]